MCAGLSEGIRERPDGRTQHLFKRRSAPENLTTLSLDIREREPRMRLCVTANLDERAAGKLAKLGDRHRPVRIAFVETRCQRFSERTPRVVGTGGCALHGICTVSFG